MVSELSKTHVLLFPMASMQSQSSTPNSTPLNHHITLKLSCDNYMLWHFLMTSYLEGQKFFGYADGSIACPQKFILAPTMSSSGVTEILNPEYSVWYQQDKVILSSILSILSEAILAHVVGLKTSYDVWSTLEKMFSFQSKARIMQTRYQLATLKKGALSVADYFQKA